MKTTLTLLFAVLCAGSSSAQPLCDFMGKDSLYVTITADTITVWDMAACAYCSAKFDIAVTTSADSVFIVQTDTAGRLALCDCTFNLRASVVGLPPGTYWAVVKRDLLKGYGYSDDMHQTIGAVQFHYEPAGPPNLSWKNYQSGCNPNSSPEEPVTAPREFTLLQNYPNPFNMSTVISFGIPNPAFVTLKVYDDQGKELATLISGQRTAGFYRQTWEPANLPSGIYFCALRAGPLAATIRMALVK